MEGDRKVDLNEETLKTFVKKMPKVELHAHLNGSISRKTMQKLIDLKNERNKLSESNLSMPCLTPSDLSECFKIFNLIHKTTDSPEAIYMATCDVIKEFHDDGVYYLELRTTPKESGCALTQGIYVETVLKAIKDTCFQMRPKMYVKLLLSIDRKRSLREAEETVKIAEKHFTSSSGVVGIDLSGDPTCGDVSQFLPLLSYVKKLGLKLAVHIAEVPSTPKEIKQLMTLPPDRLGHGTFLHPSCGGCVENYEKVKELNIPLEICLTSNYFSKTVVSYGSHHFPLFHLIGYPCVICTDDKGVFNTTLSEEYCLAAEHFDLTKEDLFKMSYNSIDYTFADAGLREMLKNNWKDSKNSCELAFASDMMLKVDV